MKRLFSHMVTLLVVLKLLIISPMNFKPLILKDKFGNFRYQIVFIGYRESLNMYGSEWRETHNVYPI